MEKRKNIKDWYWFLGIVIVATIVNWNYITMHYATDTYNIINVGYERYALEWSLKDGRIWMSFIGLLANKLQIPISIYVSTLTVLAILVSCIAIIRLKNIILQYKEKHSILLEGIAVLISYITIFNFMYIENLYFVENLVMAFSIWLIIEAANQIVEKRQYHYIKAIFLIIIAVLSYQGTIGFFFAITFVFTLLKNQNNLKQIGIDVIKSGSIALISVIFNMIIVRQVGILLNLQQNRLGNIEQILENIKYISNHILDILIGTCGLYPQYLFLGFLGIVLGIGVVYSFYYKGRELHIPKMILIACLTIVSSFVVFLMTLSSFYTGRLHFCIGTLIGLLYIYLYGQTEIFEKKGILSKVASIILIGYSACGIFQSIFVLSQHKIVNQLEREQVNQINAYIEEYEKKNDIEIKKICIITFQGKNDKVYDKEIENKSVLTYNAIRSNWSSDGVINFYTGRKLEKTCITEKTLEIYLEDKKEYECIGDTLIVSAYMY